MEPIEDDEELTQYGTTRDPFRCEPRWWKEQAISLIRGRRSPTEAAKLVRGRSLEEESDAARYTTAGTLRFQGFVVTHAPTKRNVNHVAVSTEDVWSESVCQAFDGCFGEVEVAEARQGDDD